MLENGYRNHRTIASLRYVWLGIMLVLVGFLLDPVTAIGHHSLLIGGGIVVGWNLRGDVR